VLAGEESVTVGRSESLRIVLFTSFILTIGAVVLAAGLDLLLLYDHGFSSTFQYELYNFVNDAINFAFNPVICFAVYYRLSSMLSLTSNSDYIELTKYSFTGGAVASIIGFFIQLEMISAYTHTTLNLSPYFDPLNLASLAVNAARTGVSLTFLVVAAIVLAHFSSNRLFAAGTTPEESEQQQVQQG
jgi:hypothetical protein